MATRIAVATADDVADVITALLDGGSVQIREGYQPATADDAATGTLLVTITLNNPAFSASSSGIADADTTGLSGTAAASGTAGWFRALASGGAKVLDGSCSASGGSGDMQLSDTAVTSGHEITVESWSLQMPTT